MSRENVEVVRILFDRWGSDEWRRCVADDVVWDASNVSYPGLSDVYIGHAGVQEFFRSWLEPWESTEVELVEAIDAGGSVYTEMRWRGRGRGSGADVERSFFAVYGLEGGMIVRFHQYDTREQALAAAGLTD